MNIAVLVSGNGTNLQALIDAQAGGELAGGEIKLVLSDKPGARALKRAEKAGIKTVTIEAANFRDRKEYDKAISEELKKERIDMVVLAGFMRILTGGFVDEYEGRILNIHPSLLPKFKGAHAIRDVFASGIKETGVTVHYVTEDLDDGPIILQEKVQIKDSDTLETLEERVHAVEHRLYPEAVRKHIKRRT